MVALLLAGMGIGWADLPNPMLQTIYPPGGKAGSSVDVRIAGSDLDEPEQLRFSHPGIQAKAVMLPADEFWPEPRLSPGNFVVTIGEDVPPGLYDARVLGRFGFSTPRIFQVSAAEGPSEVIKPAGGQTPETAIDLQLDQVVTGKAEAGLAAYYRMQLKPNQRLVVHCWSSRLDSPMDPSLVLLNEEGREIASSQNVFEADPMLDVRVSGGVYHIKVHDSLFRSGNDYVYRLVASTQPFIQAVYPLAGAPGSKQEFLLLGKNLPEEGKSAAAQLFAREGFDGMNLELTLPQKPELPGLNGLRPFSRFTDVASLQIPGSNVIPVGLTNGPVVTDPAKEVPVPGEAQGIFGFAGKMDRWRFQAKKGQAYTLEVIADRQGIPLDPEIVLVQVLEEEDGSDRLKMVARADDPSSIVTVLGFDARTRDPKIEFKAPADGLYEVMVTDHSGLYGPCLGYRLVLQPATPDFELLAVKDRSLSDGKEAYPASVQLRPGEVTAIRVLAPRSGGFTDAIQLSAKGLPEGVVSAPSTIWTEDSEGYLWLRAEAEVKDWAGEIEIVGVSGELERKARYGTLRWGAKDAGKERLKSRLCAGMPLQVTTLDPALVTLAPVEDKLWEVELGGQLEVPYKLTRHPSVKGDLTLQPMELPGFRKPPVIKLKDKDLEGTAKISFAATKDNKPFPGTGVFVWKISGTASYEANPQAVERLTAWKTSMDKKLTALRESGADEEVKQGETAAKQLEAMLKTAKNRAKAQDVNFVTYSNPVRLQIQPAAEKK